MFSRKQLVAKLNDNLAKYTVRYESDPCTAGTPESTVIQSDLLLTVASTRTLQACGYHYYESLRYFHDGEKWVLELEAIGAGE